MENKTQLIKNWMECYPESGRGNCMMCWKYNYTKMEFTFKDTETGKVHSINMSLLRKGLNSFLKFIREGKYYNSMGQIPNILAESYQDDSQDHDALIQCAIFGEVIYG